MLFPVPASQSGSSLAPHVLVVGSRQNLHFPGPQFPCLKAQGLVRLMLDLLPRGGHSVCRSSKWELGSGLTCSVTFCVFPPVSGSKAQPATSSIEAKVLDYRCVTLETA